MSLKPLWVSPDVHKAIKSAVANNGKKINEYMKDLSVRSEKEVETIRKWRFL